jgi:hypothetical protein
MLAPLTRPATALALAAGFACSSFSMAAALPLERVTIYRSGVAAFTHSGTIDGDATVALAFDADRLSDALKSLVVIDGDPSAPPTASYRPHQDLDAVLQGYDVDPRRPLMSLLDQLRGERARVRTPEGEIEGALFGVETIKNPASGVDRQHVTLLTDRGFRTIERAQIVTIDFIDEALGAQVREALSALASHRDEDEAKLELRFTGDGSREAMATYVHAAPIWKASYRLVLPEGSGDALLQAWAVVENQTDQDWRDVALTVAAGRPVSFTMDLQTPFVPTRPEVQPPYALTAGPTVYERELRPSQRRVMPEAMEAEALGRFRSGAAAAGDVADSSAPAPQVDASAMGGQSAAAGLDAGSQFVFTFDEPVDLDRGASAMLPLVSQPVGARSVTIYSGGAPMRGVEFTNDSGVDLMPGPVAVYEAGRYAGDAQIANVSRGEERLLSYAADLDVLVVRDDAREASVSSVRIVDGTLIERVIDRFTTEYRVANRDETEPRTMLIGHPKRPGLELVAPKKPDAETASGYRFELEVAAADSASLEVTQERERLVRYAVADYSIDTLLAHAATGAASDEVRRAVVEAGRLQAEVRRIEREIAAIDARLREITEDQRRIRDNMNRVGRGGDLWNRYATKLSEQEDEIERLMDRRDALRGSLEEAQRSLRDYLRGLDVQ